jgi:hypothetical protein
VETECATLSQLDGAPNWLAKQVLDFAKSNPNDPRVPEALHFATHLGCTDANSRRYSKSPFLLLHKRYPQSVDRKNTLLSFTRPALYEDRIQNPVAFALSHIVQTNWLT